MAESLNYIDLDALKAAIGENHVSAKSVAERVRKPPAGRRSDPRGAAVDLGARAEPPRAVGTAANTAGVHVEGLDDVMVRLSRCCTPVPGDEIMGFVTRGRGVSVHRADCANAVSLAVGQSDRLIEVEWDEDRTGTFVASIEVKALDRSRLLRDVSAALADAHVNIIACNTITGSDRISKMRFDFELGDAGHLDALIRSIKQIDSIYDAYRVLPGSGSSREKGASPAELDEILD